MKEKYLELFEMACEARTRAYVPYSGYSVGAALLCKNGKIFLGCNIENSAFTPTSCAERTAIFKAVSECEREFEAIAVVAGKDKLEPPSPCGVCRQVMLEFCDDNFEVILGTCVEDLYVTTLGDLIPNSFRTYK
ncbi:MAG: cytidine deaminase [Bacillota bacterium]